MGLLNDERYNIQTEVKIDHVYDPLPRGRDFNPRHYDTAIMALLQPHPSSWRVLDKRDYAELANTSNHGGKLKFLTQRGGKWTEVRDLQQAKVGEGIAVFVRRPSTENKYGGGGGSPAALTALAPQAYENLDPTVLIASPDNGARIDLDKDKTHVSTAFQEHTFTATDSVESVTRSLVKRNDPDAIYNYNPSFHPNKPPQEADTVRVAVGKSLFVKGTVSNSGSVLLNWQSKDGSNGSQTINVKQGGKNEVVGWEAKIDRIQPGDYTFVASAGKARSVSQAKLVAAIPEKEKIAVRVGVFFDGTGNNMHNDIPNGTDTNIVRLYELYNGTPENLSPIPIGKYHGLDLYTVKLYENGIGTKDGEADSDYGMAVGTNGVQRINDALEKIESILTSKQDMDGPRIIDVFGFSRGAALARDFINQVHAKFSGMVTEVGFVGLFETVGSFGLSGNNIDKRSDDPLLINSSPVLAAMTESFNLNLGPASATKIVHLTAKNEIRANFDLQSLRTGKGAALPSNMEEIEVPGVHSDVGGGYGPNPEVVIDRVDKRYINYTVSEIPEAWSGTAQRKYKVLEDEASERGLTLKFDRRESNGPSEKTDYYWLQKERTVKPGLSNVYLHAMYYKAGSSNVPLYRIKEFEGNEPLRFAIATDLKRLVSTDNVTPINIDELQENYIHMSHRDWEDADQEHRYVAHHPSSTRTRDIFYNHQLLFYILQF